MQCFSSADSDLIVAQALQNLSQGDLDFSTRFFHLQATNCCNKVGREMSMCAIDPLCYTSLSADPTAWRCC
jgi:hypothetical protein